MPDENESTPPPPSGGAYTGGEKINSINVADEIKNSFLDYSMSVIISRALPDVRDGLKPSQRRILYAMHELSLYPGRKPYKCAKICGDTSGNYHPHGEAVIYPTLAHIAQHNLGEIVDGICAQIDNPNITIPQLMKFIKGPDFPTGGVICGVEGIKNYFETGKGSIKLRGRVGAEELKGNREQLVITEIPFNVNRAALEEKIAALVNEKTITEISAMRNESDENCRLVMELKRDGNPKVVIANLYK